MKSKRTGIVVGLVVVAVIVCGGVLAQREPGGPGGPPMPPMGPPRPMEMMEAGDAGVFVLQGPVLLKFDAALKPRGSLKFELPAPPDAPDGMRPPIPGLPPVLLIAPGSDGLNEKVLVIIGGTFYSVDAESLKVTAKANLPAMKLPEPPPDAPEGMPGPPPPGDGGPGMRPPMPMGPPPMGLALHGRMLYLLRGHQIFAINVDSGAVTGPTTLPRPPQPGA